MCAILDANIASDVFGSNRPIAGKEFHEWISKGPGRLVIGGKLRRELARTRAREWLRVAISSGRAKQLSDQKVDQKAQQLKESGKCRSDDHHVIALAQLSGTRLLYSEDTDLRDDFKDKQLISSPKGTVYPTGNSRNARQDRKQLFANRNLCREER